MNESKGISNINKEEIEKIYTVFKLNGYVIDYEYQYNLERLISLSFKKENNYNGVCFVKEQQKISLIINIPLNYDKKLVKETISHELIHLLELNNIMKHGKNLPKYSSIQKTLQKYQPETIVMKSLKDIFYKTLDNEINANIAQTYTFLLNSNINDYNNLKKELLKYQNRINYENILKLDIKKINNDIFDNIVVFIEFQELIKLLKKHKVDYFYRFLKTDSETDILNKLLKISKNNIERLLMRQLKIIDEVIIDMNEKYFFTDVNSNLKTSFEEYINMKQ